MKPSLLLPHVAKIDDENVVALEQRLPGLAIDFFDLGSGCSHEGCGGMSWVWPSPGSFFDESSSAASAPKAPESVGPPPRGCCSARRTRAPPRPPPPAPGAQSGVELEISIAHGHLGGFHGLGHGASVQRKAKADDRQAIGCQAVAAANDVGVRAAAQISEEALRQQSFVGSDCVEGGIERLRLLNPGRRVLPQGEVRRRRRRCEL